MLEEIDLQRGGRSEIDGSQKIERGSSRWEGFALEETKQDLLRVVAPERQDRLGRRFNSSGTGDQISVIFLNHHMVHRDFIH